MGALLAGVSFNASSQALEQGMSVIDVNYGFPNLFANVIETAATGFNSTDIKTSAFGPVSLKYEYMVSDRIGLGVEFNYANASVSYTDQGQDGNTYDYKLSVPRFRALPKFNVHFGNSDVLDFYASLAGGYSSFEIKEETNDPNYDTENLDLTLSNFAFRVAFGTRVFVSDSFGFGAEIGFGGGALLAAGLTYRIGY